MCGFDSTFSSKITRQHTARVLFRNCCHTGEQSHFGLPAKRHYCVILVDGLGVENLLHRPGHARFLAKEAQVKRTGYSVFPSTTAANIMSFATGLTVADHGFVGHQVYDRSRDSKLNMLTGWEEENPEDWQSLPTLSETAANKGLGVKVIGPAEYRDSGYSRASMRQVEYQVAESIAERFQAAERIFHSKGRSVSYLYIPELDKHAHRLGWLSDGWFQLLEQVDTQVARLVSRLPDWAGLVLTADHGVVDSPVDNRIRVDSEHVFEGLEHFAGDSRAAYLYFKDDFEITEQAVDLEHVFSEVATVHSGKELLAGGIFGDTATRFESRIPDLVMLAKGNYTLFHSHMSKPRSIQMVAHHGGLSSTETRIPIFNWTQR